MKKLIITMALVSSVSLFANTPAEKTLEEVIVSPLVVIDEEEVAEEASLALVVPVTEEVEEATEAEEALASFYNNCGDCEKDKA